jgi:surface protein
MLSISASESVTNMEVMFLDSNFNQDIGSWDVSNVTNMRLMFVNTLSINQDISSWNVDNVTGCTQFSFDTPQWTLPKPNFTNCTE